MLLKNKKTGEIHEIMEVMSLSKLEKQIVLYSKTDKRNYKYKSLAELNEEWEDYEEPKEYWFIDYDSRIVRFNRHEETATHSLMKQIGNYFETKEEAEKAVEKLKAWKRLKDNGLKIKGWKFTPDMKQIQGNYVKIEAEIPQILINEEDIDLLFSEVKNEI